MNFTKWMSGKLLLKLCLKESNWCCLVWFGPYEWRAPPNMLLLKHGGKHICFDKRSRLVVQVRSARRDTNRSSKRAIIKQLATQTEGEYLVRASRTLANITARNSSGSSQQCWWPSEQSTQAGAPRCQPSRSRKQQEKSSAPCQT